jgi:hypothetical protein
MLLKWAPCLFVAGGLPWHDEHPVGFETGLVAWQDIPPIAVADIHEGAVPPPATPFKAVPWQSTQSVFMEITPTVVWLVVLATLSGVPTRPVIHGVGCEVFGLWQVSQPAAIAVLARLNLGLMPLDGVAWHVWQVPRLIFALAPWFAAATQGCGSLACPVTP